MLKLFLWLRYLRKRKIVLLSISAVTVSVCLLIVVASLFTGFINAFEQSAVDTLGDVVVMAPEVFEQYPLFIEQLLKIEYIEAVTPTITSQGLLYLEAGNVRAVHVWGIEPISRASVTTFENDLLLSADSGAQPSFSMSEFPDDIGGFVGIGVLSEPDVETDEYDAKAIVEQWISKEVMVTTGTISSSHEVEADELSIERKLLSFRINDIFYSGVYDFDSRFIYLPIKTLQQTLYPDNDSDLADQVQVKLVDGADPELAVIAIQGLWEAFAFNVLQWDVYKINKTDIMTAQQMQHEYVVELQKQMGVLLLIFGVVSFSIVVLIFCIFYMIVRLKQKDIAIVKCCGASGGSLVAVFLGFGFCVGAVGSIAGTAAGYIITKNINIIESWIRIIFGLKLWSSSIYIFDKIPNQMSWISVVYIVLFTLVGAMVGTLLPALIAAKTRPVQILRYE